MKKILYIVSTLKRCGPINQLSYIIKYLDKEKFEPIVLSLSPEPNEDSMKNYFESILKIKVETLGLSRLQGLLFAKHKLKQFISQNNIDIVHSQGIRADGLMSKIDMPKIATLRNYPYYDYPMAYGNIKGNIMAKFHLRYLKKIDEPRVVSQSVSNMLREKNDYKISYVQNGTDLDRFLNLEKNLLRKKLNINEKVKIFVSVGHLSDGKDPLTVVEAFKKAKLENSKLLFLGDGPLYEACKKEISNLKDIELIGRVDNVNEYLGASDYFISASLTEGLPNTVLEAMACGLPCILSNIPPHKEIAEIDKSSSLFFELRDVDELTRKLQEILKKDYESMSKASKNIVLNYLNAKIMSKNYQDIYSSLLDK